MKSTKVRKSNALRFGTAAGTEATVLVHGRYLVSNTAAATTDSINLNPLLLDNRLASVSDSFQEYRFTHLDVKMWQGASGGNFNPMMQVAYSPVILTNAPTTTTLSSLPNYAAQSLSAGNGPAHIRVSRKELFTNAPRWFRRGTAYDDLLETQGSIWFGSSSSFSTAGSTVFLLIEYEVELRAQADSSLTAAPRASSGSVETELKQVERAIGMGAVDNPRRAIHESPLRFSPQEAAADASSRFEQDMVLVPRSSVAAAKSVK
jgi:hypothetical protein